MKLVGAAAAAAAAAVAAVGCLAELESAESCCSEDSDCVELLEPANIEYLTRFSKTVECDQDCPELLNCAMFGLCDQCRGCFETCEGAMLFMNETGNSADVITFCSGIGIADMAQCEDDVYGSGAGSGSMYSGGSAYGSGSGAGGGSEMSQAGSAYGSGSGAGGGSMSGSASGAGSGAGGGSMSSTASGAGSGSGGIAGDSASGSALDSASEGVTALYGSGGGSGAGSMSSGTGTAGGSGDATRVAEIEGCDCGTAGLEQAEAEPFCANGKSMYCDLECVDGSDPGDRLFPSMGGLWCQPEGWEGCRICKFDCEDYDGDDCVPCPEGVKDWCR